MLVKCTQQCGRKNLRKNSLVKVKYDKVERLCYIVYVFIWSVQRHAPSCGSFCIKMELFLISQSQVRRGFREPWTSVFFCLAFHLDISCLFCYKEISFRWIPYCWIHVLPWLRQDLRVCCSFSLGMVILVSASGQL